MHDAEGACACLHCDDTAMVVDAGENVFSAEGLVRFCFGAAVVRVGIHRNNAIVYAHGEIWLSHIWLEPSLRGFK